MSLSPRDKQLTLIGLMLALFLGALDQTIVSTALPKIVEDLHGLSRYAWVATAYLLASTVLVPVYGKLADMYSRKAIMLWSVVLFLLGSFLCGIAGEFGSLPLLGDGMNQLIVFRAVQGLGGAGFFAMVFIVIADLYPPSERGKYQGLIGGVFGIASVLGPWIGGLLTDYGGSLIPGIAGWRWVFYVNLPFGALALWFIARRMPPLLPQGERAPLDVLSAVFLTGGLVPFLLALQLDKNAYPWTGATTLALFGTAALMIALFVLRSLRSPNPILDLSLFGNKVFSTANAALFFIGAAFLSIVIFLPLFMVNVLGVSATSAGLSLIPLSFGVVAGSIASGQIVSRFGHYRRLMLIGGLTLLVGVYLLANMQTDIPYWRVTLYMVVCGLGLGPAMPLYTLAIQNAVDVRKVGQATSASQFFRQIGGTVGAAVMGTVLATSLASSFASLPLPLAGAAAEFATAGEGSAVSGGAAALEARIRQAFDEQYQLVAERLRSGDLEGLGVELEASPMPEEAQSAVMRGARLAVASPVATEAFLGTLRAELDEQADAVVAQVSQGVREAFTEAITRIYFYSLFIVAIGWLVTTAIPEIELRRSNEGAAQPITVEA